MAQNVMPKLYEPSEERLQKFRDALKAVCQEHQLWLYFSNEECYDCGGTVVVDQPQIITAQDMQKDLQTMEWYDMEAEIEKAAADARKAAAYAKAHAEYQLQIKGVIAMLKEVFLRYQMVLWVPSNNQVRFVPFQEHIWQKIDQAPLKANPFRCQKLVERAITPEHEQKVANFKYAVQVVCMQEGLIPDADGLPRNVFQNFSVSPLFNDPLPEWLEPVRGPHPFPYRPDMEETLPQ